MFMLLLKITLPDAEISYNSCYYYTENDKEHPTNECIPYNLTTV